LWFRASPHEYGGLGLGLYLADQVVRARGGLIPVESEPEKGAKFTVKLPP
jgi:signal transduction histidine kinase